MVLQRAGQHLGGRGAVLVHEHHQRRQLPAAGHLGVGFGVVLRLLAQGGHELARAGNKLVGQARGAVEVAAGIAAQVQYQALHAVALQVGQLRLKLFVSAGRKPIDFDVARLLILQQHAGLHGRVGQPAPAELQPQRLRLARPGHRQAHAAAARPVQQPPQLPVAEARAGHGDRAHAQQLVAGQQARPGGRAAGQQVHHRRGIPKNVELQPYPVEAALQKGIGLLPVLGPDVGRVRVEPAQQLRHGVVG